MSRRFDYRFIDDVTGFKRWRSQGTYRWDGCLVQNDRSKGLDPYPLYLIPPNSTDQIAVPDSRPDAPAVEIFPVPADLDNVPNF
jgi:hypothetical protein